MPDEASSLAAAPSFTAVPFTFQTGHFLLSVMRSIATEHEQAVVPQCCVPVVGLLSWFKKELVEKESFKHCKLKLWIGI